MENFCSTVPKATYHGELLLNGLKYRQTHAKAQLVGILKSTEMRPIKFAFTLVGKCLENLPRHW